MPSISEFYGLSVYMYNNGREHNPPHFHAKYGNYKVSITIGRRKVIAGSFPPKQLEDIKEWAKYHKLQLLHNWN